MLKKLLLTLSLISCAGMLGMNNYEEGAMRRLAVFFTGLETVNEEGPCSVQASCALHQKSSPLLIAKNVLYNALKTESQKHTKDLFNYDDWIIRQIGEHFLVLVPLSYLSEKKIASKPSKQQITDDVNATNFELEVGLRLDHLEQISEEQLYNEIKIRTLPEQVSSASRSHIVSNILPLEFRNIVYNTEKQISTLFVLKKEYLNTEQNKPQWIVYWHGHGSPVGLIGEISSEDFLTLLYFLDLKITTRFFALFSCYAGSNLENYYNINKQTLSYTLAATSLSLNCATINYGTYDFSAFFKTLEQPFTPKTITKSCEAVMRFKNNCNNMPLIKYPGDRPLKPLDLKNSFTIDTIMGSFRKQLLESSSLPHKKSKIKQPGFIYLYTNNIEFPLKISDKKVISLVKSSSFHILKEVIIDSVLLHHIHTSAELLKIAHSIFDTNEISEGQIFFIKKLTMKNQNFYNVIFDMRHARKIYFSYHTKKFKLGTSGTCQLIEKNYLEDYITHIDLTNEQAHNGLTPDFIQKLENLYKKHPYFVPAEQYNKLKLWWNSLSEHEQATIKMHVNQTVPPIDAYELKPIEIFTDIKNYKNLLRLERLKKLEDERIQKAFFAQHMFLKSKL